MYMYTASATNSKLLYITQSPNPPNTVLHRSHDEIVKLDKKKKENRQGSHYSQHHVIKSKHHLTQQFSTFFPPWSTFTLNFFWWTPITIWRKNLFYFLLITSVDTEMCCPKGKCECQYFILLTIKKKNRGHRNPGFFNKKIILDYYFCLKSGSVFLFQIFIIASLPLPRD
jgi:hypothetical protein